MTSTTSNLNKSVNLFIFSSFYISITANLNMLNDYFDFQLLIGVGVILTSVIAYYVYQARKRKSIDLLTL